jgi:hypothetical protein
MEVSPTVCRAGIGEHSFRIEVPLLELRNRNDTEEGIEVGFRYIESFFQRSS